MSSANGILPPGLAHLDIASRENPQAKSRELGTEEFFELMLAQMKNQDPLNPLGTNEFLSQVAQFTTAGSVKDMQQSIQELSSSLRSGQALQATTLVGRDVLVPGRQAALATGGAVRGALELGAASGDVQVRITDSSGALVRQIPLGAHGAGMVPFAWDGLADDGSAAAPGSYVIEATAVTEGETLAAETFVTTRVESVTLGQDASQLTLNLAGVGPVRLADVRELL